MYTYLETDAYIPTICIWSAAKIGLRNNILHIVGVQKDRSAHGWNHRKTSDISRTFVGNKIVDNSDVIGASPVGAAPTTSSFST